MPDHVALELEYMSLLSLRDDEDAIRDFLARHMDWLNELAREIEVASEGPFYSSGARIACAIVERARGTTPAITRL